MNAATLYFHYYSSIFRNLTWAAGTFVNISSCSLCFVTTIINIIIELTCKFHVEESSVFQTGVAIITTTAIIIILIISIIIIIILIILIISIIIIIITTAYYHSTRWFFHAK